MIASTDYSLPCAFSTDRYFFSSVITAFFLRPIDSARYSRFLAFSMLPHFISWSTYTDHRSTLHKSTVTV
jgi:hypothetical protein